jgi:hypothetical protein
MAIEPFLMTYRRTVSGASKKIRQPLPSSRFSRSRPTASTWPLTRWPPIRAESWRARSRFTLAPALSSPRFVTRSVSTATSAENSLLPISTTVRQTPLTEMLSPSAVPSSTVAADNERRAAPASRRSAFTVPISSMIPVNMLARSYFRRGRRTISILRFFALSSSVSFDATG